MLKSTLSKRMLAVAAPMADRSSPEHSEGLAGAASAGSTLHALTARRDVGMAANVAAAVSLVAFGVADVGRAGSPPHLDMHFLFAAGRMWSSGHSPYVLTDFVRDSDAIQGLAHQHVHMGFGYPPTIAPVCMLLGALPLDVAGLLMVGLNVVAAYITAAYCLRLNRAGVSPGEVSTSLGWIVPALVVGNPFTTHVVHSGQTTMLATAAVVAGWYYSEVRGSQIVSGLLFALSTIKPQVSVLCVLWILTRVQWRQLAALALGAAALSAVPLHVSGPWLLARQWVGALRDYEGGPIQHAGFQNVFGIQSALVSAGITTPKLTLVAILFALYLWWRRNELNDDAILGLLLAASCLFVYAHDYDLAALAPFFGVVWKRAASSNARAGLALGFFALLFAPQRFVRFSHIGLVVHWREFVLLAATAWVLADLLRSASGPRRATVPSAT